MNIATALALARSAAITTAAIFVVLQSIAGYTGAILGHHAAHLLQTLLQRQLRAIQFCRALENAVRQIRQILFHPSDAQIQINFVVVRFDVAVADWPIRAITVAILSLEIVIRKPQRQASPDIRLSPEASRADPGV